MQGLYQLLEVSGVRLPRFKVRDNVGVEADFIDARAAFVSHME